MTNKANYSECVSDHVESAYFCVFSQQVRRVLLASKVASFGCYAAAYGANEEAGCLSM